MKPEENVELHKVTHTEIKITEINGNLDCSAVMADIWLLIDGEADDNLRNELLSHIEECSHCVEGYSVEKMVKKLINNKCKEKSTPEDLKLKILKNLPKND